MFRFRFKKIDAFATPVSSGNPAGAVYLDSFADITESQMQRIGRELKGFVCETGFLTQVAPDTFRIRYFSSEREVEFCGHATVAILYDLLRQNTPPGDLPHIFLQTNKGTLKVENRIAAENAVFVYAPEPVFAATTMDQAEAAQALGVSVRLLDEAIPLGTVNAGNQTLCVPFRTAGDVLAVSPDYATLLRFCQQHRLDVVAIFSRDTIDPANRLRTRIFAPPFGYLEDPATGSGNAALGYSLNRLGLWDGSPIRIEQNADPHAPNIVRLSSVPDAEHGIRVIFGGAAIVRIEGEYCLV